MSEEAATSSDSKKVDNEATTSTKTCDNANHSKSPLKHETVADTVNAITKVNNHVDVPTSSQNNLDLCSEEEDCENEVDNTTDTSSQLPTTLNGPQIISNRLSDQIEPTAEPSTDYYVVSNENIVEPSPISDTIEDVGNLNAYRDSIIGDDTDSTDSDSSSTVSEDEDVDSDNNSSEAEPIPEVKKCVKPSRNREGRDSEEFPPIEDLNITVDESKCKEIGTIDSIVDTQVVIQSLPDTPALDLDTVLFLDRGKRPLGRVFDVLGSIHGPFYAVRFNSAEHIKERNVEKHQKVYFVPESDYTSYVNTAELMKQKGSDASWKNNKEPPVTSLDFSDDEDEARAKRPGPVVGSKRDSPSDNDMFVKRMNQRNLELTAKRKKEDEAKQKRVPLARRMISNAKNSIDMSNSNALAYPHYAAEGYKQKSRSYSNAEQAAAATRLVNFHHHAGSNPMNKFDPVSRFLVGGYSSPSNYAFPPQHFLCSSPRQLPSVVPNAQNYLTMYSRPSIQTTNAMQPPPPPPPPFTSYAAMPPTFTTQPAMHPLQQPLHGPIPPPQFSSFAPLSAPPLPSSIPQPYFSCADTSPVPPPTFIPMNVRPGLSTASFHQFVLPPPPPPATPSIQHHSHGREVALPRPDRRNAQSSHSNASYYPHSPYNS